MTRFGRRLIAAAKEGVAIARGELDVNPKSFVGATKVDTFLFPSIALLHGAHGHMDGARKYGAYGWRKKAVLASTYLSALERHIQSWKEREECASDSGVHHLGHALACIAIILDAQALGNLVDDRPFSNPGFAATLIDLNKKIKEQTDARGLSDQGKSKLHRGRTVGKRSKGRSRRVGGV